MANRNDSSKKTPGRSGDAHQNDPRGRVKVTIPGLMITPLPPLKSGEAMKEMTPEEIKTILESNIIGMVQ